MGLDSQNVSLKFANHTSHWEWPVTVNCETGERGGGSGVTRGGGNVTGEGGGQRYWGVGSGNKVHPNLYLLKYLCNSEQKYVRYLRVARGQLVLAHPLQKSGVYCILN